MLISFLLVSSLLLIDSSTGCCCNIKWSCGCNAFGCNCVTVNGWCKKVYDSVTHGGHVLIQPLCSNPGFGFNSGCTVCWSSQGKKDQEYCPAERRRMKRSTTIAQAYGEIHPDLIDRHEIETFLRFESKPLTSTGTAWSVWKRRTEVLIPPSRSSHKLMPTMMDSFTRQSLTHPWNDLKDSKEVNIINPCNHWRFQASYCFYQLAWNLQWWICSPVHDLNHGGSSIEHPT